MMPSLRTAIATGSLLLGLGVLPAFGDGFDSSEARAKAIEALRHATPADATRLDFVMEAPSGAALDRGANERRIGDGVRYHLRTDGRRHLLVVQVDAQGVVTVLARTTTAAGEKVSKLPPAGEKEWVALPPVGPVEVFAWATFAPIEVPDLPDDPTIAFFEGKAAVAFANGISEALDRLGPDQVASAELQTTTLGRAGRRGVQLVGSSNAPIPDYLASDVVAYFTSERAQRVQAARLDLQVRFASGSDQLGAETRANLEIIAVALLAERLRDRGFVVGGHTDDTGPAAFNLELSRRRAEAARDYLIERGVAESRLRVQGYGETRPLQADASAQARALNRRVEFEMQADGG